MADQESTENAPESSTPEGSTPEAVEARDQWKRQVAKAEADALRAKWGGTDEVVARRLNDAAFVRERLGHDDETLSEYSKSMGEAGLIDHASSLGPALRAVPADLSTEQALERIEELKSDREFFAKLKDGDKATRRLWDGLNAVAYHSHKPR